MTVHSTDTATILETVLDVLRQELHIEPHGQITEDDHLDILPNADSVRLMRTVSALERHYDVEFDDTEIRTAQTVRDLVALVRGTLIQETGA